MIGCFNCQQDRDLGRLPVRDRVHASALWRLVHAWSSLPGWLVLISRRHVVSPGELNEAEAVELGQLIRAASAALSDVVGCDKTYVVMFGEKPGFEHLHFHIVPRMADLDEPRRGSGIFAHLKAPESEWVPDSERDRIGLLVGRRIREFASPPPE